MENPKITSNEIVNRTLEVVAPLPCQKEYLRQLAAIFSFHIHRNHLMDEGYSVDDLPPMSAIVVAPTGQGKTFLLRKMAEVLEINLITVDCSTLAAEGWKGVGLGQRLLTARKKAKNQNAFERSVLFLDEVDKLHLWGTSSDQGNSMNNILQLYNSGCVVTEGTGKESVSIDVKRFIVLLGGAFEGIERIVRERLKPQSRIGFCREEEKKLSKADQFQQVTKEDLVVYGMLPELLGRIGSILTIQPLALEDYCQLLRGDNGSIQCQYRNYLRGLYGISFALTDGAVDSIARECMDSGNGARAVTPIVNDLMRGALPDVERDEKINAVVLDADKQGLCVRYEYGNRGYCYSDSAGEKLPVNKLKGKTCKVLANKLCRYYRNAGGDLPALPLLHSFFECSLGYLKENTAEEEFSFDSLEKLARTVRRKNVNSSRFEIMMGGRDLEGFDRFCELYTTSTQRDLVMALQRIMNYLQNYYGRVHIQFSVKKKRTK